MQTATVAVIPLAFGLPPLIRIARFQHRFGPAAGPFLIAADVAQRRK